MKRAGILVLVFLSILTTSCKMSKDKQGRVAVAECYGKYLYDTDLKGIVMPGTNKLDSISRTRAFIDSWIHHQILIHQAEKNLSPDELDFSQELQDYRNSLVIYAYESALIKQRLDTIVSEEELERYYDENKENFQVHHNMVKVAYVILPEGNQHVSEFRKLMSRNDTVMIQQVDNLATKYNAVCYLDIDSWIRLDDLLKAVPLEIYNTEGFLKKNFFISFDKDGSTYLLRFKDFLLKESVSPLEIERGNIKDVILMKRKKDLLEKMNYDLYEKASHDKAFAIY